MNQPLSLRLGAIGIALLAAWPASHAAELMASATGAQVGGIATLTLQFDTSESFFIGAVNLDFTWDKPGLHFDRDASSALGSSLPDLVALGDKAPSMTVETVTDVSYTLSSFLAKPLPYLLAGPQTLTLKFHGLTADPDPYYVTAVTVELLDDQFATAFTSGGRSFPITITAIPEPQPALMLLAGLTALGWLARRRAA